MCLCFPAKNLHLVLIKTFVRTELQLCRPVVEVNIGNGVADIFAEVTCFGALERSSTPKKEAIFRAENRPRWSNNLTWLGTDVLVTPRAIIFYKKRQKKTFILVEVVTSLNLRRLKIRLTATGKSIKCPWSERRYFFGQCHKTKFNPLF